MPSFILDDEEGRWDILIGFALAMPQVAVAAFAAIGALYMFGYAIWLWFYRRGEARRRT